MKKNNRSAFEIKPAMETFAKIKVVGVGGSGGNALSRMIQNKIRGVEFIAINTDAQALAQSQATDKVHIGKELTRGLGAGMDPEIGKRAAEESDEMIKEALSGADMVFITCGMGGGTGTGASAVIADIARELGALTIAVVTKPFTFEGAQRRRIADQGIAELGERVDTILTIPNDRILQVIDRKTSLLEAFRIVDEVLHQGVAGISEIITVPGLINVDFADVKAIMKDTGSALMGIGRASGENRAREAAEGAISSPLLELSIDGARGILFTVTAGPDLSMAEVADAADIITKHADPEAKVIFGTVIDPSMGEEMKVTVIATGFNDKGASAVSKSRKLEVEAKRQFMSPQIQKDQKTEVMAPPVIKEKEEEPIRFIRRERETKKIEIPDLPMTAEESELDIPAFIRKKLGR
ncbi:MAG: cell division protein FtsZ [bacterium]